jgi:hypothetical protein
VYEGSVITYVHQKTGLARNWLASRHHRDQTEDNQCFLPASLISNYSLLVPPRTPGVYVGVWWKLHSTEVVIYLAIWTSLAATVGHKDKRNVNKMAHLHIRCTTCSLTADAHVCSTTKRIILHITYCTMSQFILTVFRWISTKHKNISDGSPSV